MTKKRSPHEFSRRRFLRGLKYSLALPLLESISPDVFAACANQQAPRFIAIYMPNGVVLDEWYSYHPGGGADAVESFANWQSGAGTAQNTTILTGNQWSPARSMQHITSLGLKNKISLYHHLSTESLVNQRDGGEHPAGLTAFLTQNGPKRNSSGIAYCDISLDQVIADYYASINATPEHSIHLTCGLDHYFADAVPIEFSERMSWDKNRNPVFNYLSPLAAFTRYIGGSPATPLSEASQRQSVIDFVLDDANSLRVKLGTADRIRLDEYLTSVRETEIKLQQNAEGTSLGGSSCGLNQIPMYSYTLGSIDYSSYDRALHMQMHFEIMKLALRCNLTNVMTFVIDHERSEYTYVSNGHRDNYHGAQHGSSEGLGRIVDTNMKEIARFLADIDGINDANGKSILDNSVVMAGSGLMGRWKNQYGEDNTHNRKALPIVYAGSGGGRLKTNQHVAFPFGTKLANAHNTLLNQVYLCNNAGFANSDSILTEMLT